jgi:hypothetical protein
MRSIRFIGVDEVLNASEVYLKLELYKPYKL